VWSLNQTAHVRHTDPAFLEGVSRENLTGAELEAFEKYVAGGTEKIMPAGLVYYTAHRGGPAG